MTADKHLIRSDIQPLSPLFHPTIGSQTIGQAVLGRESLLHIVTAPLDDHRDIPLSCQMNRISSVIHRVTRPAAAVNQKDTGTLFALLQTFRAKDPQLIIRMSVAICVCFPSLKHFFEHGMA